jgi:hypothetical protein
VDEPVVGKDREPRRLQGEERHHLLLRFRVTSGIRHRGLIAVVAVGDDHRRVGHQRLDPPDHVGIGDAPESVVLAAQIGRLGDRVTPPGGGSPQAPVRIADEHEQQADVRTGPLQQLHPIALGAGVRPLVRQHDASRIVADLAERDEAAPGHLAAAHAVGLRVRVDRLSVVALPPALTQPPLERSPSALVLVGDLAGPGSSRGYETRTMLCGCMA